MSCQILGTCKIFKMVLCLRTNRPVTICPADLLWQKRPLYQLSHNHCPYDEEMLKFYDPNIGDGSSKPFISVHWFSIVWLLGPLDHHLKPRLSTKDSQNHFLDLNHDHLYAFALHVEHLRRTTIGMNCFSSIKTIRQWTGALVQWLYAVWPDWAIF